MFFATSIVGRERKRRTRQGPFRQGLIQGAQKFRLCLVSVLPGGEPYFEALTLDEGMKNRLLSMNLGASNATCVFGRYFLVKSTRDVNERLPEVLLVFTGSRF